MPVTPLPPPAAGPTWAHWLLGAEPAQRIRMSMAGMTSLLIAGCVGIGMWLVGRGFGYPQWAAWWAGATGIAFALVLVLIRTGWSLRLRDPALTQWQIRLAIVCNAGAYVVVGQARGVSSVMLALALIFGSFGMSQRQLLANVVFTVGAFAVAMGLVDHLEGSAQGRDLQIAYGVVIALVLLGTTFVSLRLQRIRQRLAAQKQELSSALERIEHLAMRDELTGLLNRRHMAEHIAAQLLRSTRSSQPLALAMLDLDRFKRINDTEGHAAGDEVLRVFAREVRQTVRSTDALARWGGEEFVLLLDCPQDAALQQLERVRTHIEQLRIPFAGRTLQATVSIGLAMSEPGEAMAALLERADRALYTAKAQGRNRVVACGGRAQPCTPTTPDGVAIAP